VDVSLAVGDLKQPLPPAGQDFEPPAGFIVNRPEKENVTFGPDVFDQPPPAGGVAVTVEARATFGVTPSAGVSLDAARARLTELLEGFFAGLTAGAQVTSDALLKALRDDPKYALDPLRLQVTLTTPEQFAQVAHGGQSFAVGENHSFTVVSVEVAP
jgi:hypothetical protein